MALLGRPWALHNVEDVEAFAARIVDRRRLDWLSWHEREALVTYLVETAWELSLRYRPMGYSFSQWARPTLERRTIDWLRKEFGRTRWQFAGYSHERECRSHVPLDELDDAGLAGAVPAGAGDPAFDSSPDLGGLLATGDRQEARDYLALGLEPPRRAA